MRLIIFSILFCPLYFLWGQTNEEIFVAVDYQETSFPEMVSDLESRYGLTFFYAENWVDTLKITIKDPKISLGDVLQKSFDNTPLFFYFDNEKRVIITKDYQIKPKIRVSEIDSEPETLVDLTIFDEVINADSIDLNNPENQTFPIGNPQLKNQGKEASISGYLRDSKSGEVLVGASIFEEESKIGVVTDNFGYYVITLPKGPQKVQFRYLGKKNTYRNVRLHSDGKLDVELEDNIVSLKEVEITGERSNVETVQTGVARINIAEIKSIPTVLGEADVMKITLTLPGVQTVGEGANGFNVRGGATSQNLITIDEGVIYNPSHLFGFFSAFNPDLIKSANLYKSGIQARFGGRVSSIFDVAVKDGNKKKHSLSGGISPITGKLTVEGPLKKDEGSYILGVRSTYSDWLLNLLEDPNLASSNAFFGDILGKVNYQLGEKNSVSVVGYHSRDLFQLASDTVFRYQNTQASVRWRHLFNNKFSGLISAGYSGYGFQVDSKENPATAFSLGYQMAQGSFKADFDYFPSDKHHLRFGWQNHFYSLAPGTLQPEGDSSLAKPILIDRENAIETALYIGDEFNVNARISLYAGLRFSGYALVGPGQVNEYAQDRSREVEFITNTVQYDPGSIIQTYGGPEIRFSGRYKFTENLSLKASYDKTRQYIHMLTNTVAISPTDTWRLSSTYLRPEIGDQFALGIYQNWPKKGLEFSFETYFKVFQNLLEYKNGAELLINEAIETDVINADGRAFGGELLLKKKSGKLNGWLSYTYARSLIRANGAYPEEVINQGEFYPSNFDRPHNLSLILNYKFTRRINISFNTTYSTGRPTTLPVTTYQFNNISIPFFSNRNQYRIPDYFRMDLAVNIEGNHRVRKFLHSSWSFSVYNLTGRNNAYSVFSRIEENRISTYQLAIFSRAIPTITYNFQLR